MDKPKGVIQQRWGQINPAKAGGGGGGGEQKKGGKNGGEDVKKDDAANDNNNKTAEEPKKLTKAEKKAAKKEANAVTAAANNDNAAPAPTPATKPGSEDRFTLNEWVTLQEDDLFSFGELQLLSELIAQYDAGRWWMVASRFFDKTGRRVHLDDVRDKFLGALG